MTNTERTDGSELYDASYYEHHCGDRAYDPDDPAWSGFFASVADRIITDIAPNEVLDVGCAFGFLVAALRDRNVDAKGFDFSEYAIGQAPRVSPNLEGNVWVASATEPIDGHYDLITCVEVIEHLDDTQGRLALKNMTAACDRLLLSSTPLDFTEPTHINVRPVEYWAEILATLGFYRDHTIDTDFLTPWAGLFVRTQPDHRTLVRDYERTQASLRIERGDLRRAHQALVNQQGEVNEFESLIEKHQQTIAELRLELMAANDAILSAEGEAAAARGELHLHLADLNQLRGYHDRIEDEIVDLRATATRSSAVEQELAAVKSSTTWRLTWLAMAPYRRLRAWASK